MTQKIEVARASECSVSRCSELTYPVGQHHPIAEYCKYSAYLASLSLSPVAIHRRFRLFRYRVPSRPAPKTTTSLPSERSRIIVSTPHSLVRHPTFPLRAAPLATFTHLSKNILYNNLDYCTFPDWSKHAFYRRVVPSPLYRFAIYKLPPLLLHPAPPHRSP
jgi:hypothetical protein